MLKFLTRFIDKTAMKDEDYLEVTYYAKCLSELGLPQGAGIVQRPDLAWANETAAVMVAWARAAAEGSTPKTNR